MVLSCMCWSKRPNIWQPWEMEAHVIPLWKGLQTSVSFPLPNLKGLFWFCLFLPIILPFRYLLPSKSKSSSKKKTPVVKKTKNPNYNHTFVYKNLSLEQLKDMCLELTVWDRETLSSNDFLGGVRLSLGAGRRIRCFIFLELKSIHKPLMLIKLLDSPTGDTKLRSVPVTPSRCFLFSFVNFYWY